MKHFKNLLTLTLVASALIGSQIMQASASFFSTVPSALPAADDAALALPEPAFISAVERDRVQTKLTRELEKATERHSALDAKLKAKKKKSKKETDELEKSRRTCRVLRAKLTAVTRYHDRSAQLQELLNKARTFGARASKMAGMARKRRGLALKAAKSAADKAAAEKLKSAEAIFLTPLNEFIAQLEATATRFQQEYDAVVNPVDADGNPMSPLTAGMFAEDMAGDADILNFQTYALELGAVVAKLKMLQDQALKATSQYDLVLKKQSIVETIQTLCVDHKYKVIAGGILAALGAAGGVLVTPVVISTVVEPALGYFVSAAAGYSMVNVAGVVGATTGGATGVVFGGRFDGAPVAGDPSAPIVMGDGIVGADADAGDDDL